MRLVLIVIAYLLAAVPATLVATFLLTPLWSWVEATTGVESLGHSGPAEWCFALVFGIVVLAGLAWMVRCKMRRSSRPRV